MIALCHDERHASARCAERYGRRLDAELKRRIVREIERSVAAHDTLRRLDRDTERKRIRAQRRLETLNAWRRARYTANGRERWTVCIDGTQYELIYQPERRVIVTFLPANAKGLRP